MFPFYDKREPRCFNTSHVTLYRQKKKLLLLRLIGFNTSHVTLYPCPDCCNRKSDQCFNTSHVTLYQEEREIREDKEEVSIHLMLLFIGYKIGNYCFFRLFQYISCYSLSQFLHTFEQINWKFQYISCYSLSSVCAFIFMLWIEFQYISCYSLSWILSYEGRKVLGFNTSHVTLYRLDENESYWSLVFQYISCYSLSLWINTESALQIRFNTSHVTLYLWQNGLIT